MDAENVCQSACSQGAKADVYAARSETLPGARWGNVGDAAMAFTDGMVRRWTIQQGKRMNGICVLSQGKTVECGWDHLMSHLRKKLSTPKRIFA